MGKIEKMGMMQWVTEDSTGNGFAVFQMATRARVSALQRELRCCYPYDTRTQAFAINAQHERRLVFFFMTNLVNRKTE